MIPTGTEASFTRGAIFEQFGLSISDVVPVANVTDRAQVVADLTAKGRGPSSTRPLVVIRADAPGLRRIEYTYDGTVWVPASGVTDFVTKGDADSFATAHAGLLTAMDRCVAGGVQYVWSGTAWLPESAWAPYTPSSSTINVGAGGSAVTQYRMSAGRVLVRARFQFAAGGTIVDSAKFALPMPRAALAHPYEQAPELATFHQPALIRSTRIAVQADGGSTTVVRLGTGLPVLTGDVTATNPANPINAGDVIHAVFSYDPA